jgi:transcriptional regulator with XRE-family HTH domain
MATSDARPMRVHNLLTTRGRRAACRRPPPCGMLSASMATNTPLREARLAAGTSQAALARKAQLSRLALRRLEEGASAPQLATARKLARALDMDADALWPPDAPGELEQPELPPQLVEGLRSGTVDPVVHTGHFQVDYVNARTGRTVAVETAGEVRVRMGDVVLRVTAAPSNGARPQARPRARREPAGQRKRASSSADDPPALVGPASGHRKTAPHIHPRFGPEPVELLERSG